MIKSITLRNFKVFKEKTNFEFSNINLLTGINGRGKSTLLQSLLLFKQSLEYSENTDRLILNGSCVELGKFDDVKNVDSSNADTIEIHFDFENTGFGSKDEAIRLAVDYVFDRDKLDDLVLVVKNCTIKSNKSFYNTRYQQTGTEIYLKKLKSEYIEHWVNTEPNFSFPLYNNILNRFAYELFEPRKGGNVNNRVGSLFSLNNIHYVGADRLGSKSYYSNKQLPSFISVDKQGHNLATILSKNKNLIIHPRLRIEEVEYEGVMMYNTVHTLSFQLSNWVGYVTDTDYCYIEADDDNDYIVSLNFSFDKEGINKFKPNNIGFGFSYILPIIISGLIAQPNDILIVENPEAHLHPRAQSRLARFLAKVANTGVQVFIESHSEHILNALRICTLDESIGLKNKQFKILYFQDSKSSELPYVELNMEQNGKITNWVDGFFDQQEIDLATIFKLGRRQK